MAAALTITVRVRVVYLESGVLVEIPGRNGCLRFYSWDELDPDPNEAWKTT